MAVMAVTKMANTLMAVTKRAVTNTAVTTMAFSKMTVTRLAAVVSGEAEFEQAEEEPSGVLDVEYSETNPAVPAGDDSTEEGVSDTGGQAGRAEGEEERDDEPDPVSMKERETGGGGRKGVV